MKRYVAFVAWARGAGGGWEDVLTEDTGRREPGAVDPSALSFDSVEEAMAAARTAAGGEKEKYWHVVDLHEGRIVAQLD